MPRPRCLRQGSRPTGRVACCQVQTPGISRGATAPQLSAPPGLGQRRAHAPQDRPCADATRRRSRRRSASAASDSSGGKSAASSSSDESSGCAASAPRAPPSPPRGEPRAGDAGLRGEVAGHFKDCTVMTWCPETKDRLREMSPLLRSGVPAPPVLAGGRGGVDARGSIAEPPAPQWHRACCALAAGHTKLGKGGAAVATRQRERAGAAGQREREQRIWQLCGLSQRPGPFKATKTLYTPCRVRRGHKSCVQTAPSGVL
jgi:hypothetical protein